MDRIKLISFNNNFNDFKLGGWVRNFCHERFQILQINLIPDIIRGFCNPRTIKIDNSKYSNLRVYTLRKNVND